MRIGNYVYFAPSIRLKDLDLSDKDKLIDSFKQRMNEYYLEAIKLLNEQKSAFAAGIIEFSMIDALARYSSKENSQSRSGERFKQILCNGFKLEKEIAKRVYEEFRNGLLHENHIKNCGQFWYKVSSKSCTIENNRLMVDPANLHEELTTFFQEYIQTLKTDENQYNLFLRLIKDDFGDEIQHFRSIE
jgi:hypothetical protein